MTFETSFPVLLKEEGGYVNDPHDPGGITNLGVTKRVWEDWMHHPCGEANMRALKPSQVAPLYRVRYWNAICGDMLPEAVAFCAFDFAVNSGVSRAARFLQNIAGVTQDGHIGPATIAAVNDWIAKHSLAELVRRYMNDRRAFLKSLPTFDHFGKGWMARCDRIETGALRLC